MPEPHDITTIPLPVQPNIHIIGAGSMGLLWAAYLSRANKSVHLISRDTQPADQTVTLSLSTDSPSQSYLIHSENSQSTTTIKTLLVCTKAFDTFTAIASCHHRLDKHCDIILLQNGMGYQAKLLEAFPDFNFYVGITTEGALKQDHLCVTHTGHGSTALGCIQHHTGNKSTGMQALLKSLSNELPIQTQEDINKFQWQKLIINCVINPLTVYYNCLNGELRHNIDAQRLQHALICECRLLLQHLGKSDYLYNIEKTIDDVMHKTATNSSSMREDILHHKKTEVQYINGYIVSLAKEHGIHCPTHEFLVDYIQTGAST